MSSWKVLTDYIVDTGRDKDTPRSFQDKSKGNRCCGLHLDGALTLADAEATDPAAVMPRLTAMSLLDVVTATVTGVGRREGMTGRGRSPGRLLPLTTAEAQL